MGALVVGVNLYLCWYLQNTCVNKWILYLINATVALRNAVRCSALCIRIVRVEMLL